MNYGLEMCSNFQWNVKCSPATGGNSICTNVFMFSSTEKALPLRTPLPLLPNPLSHLRHAARCKSSRLKLRKTTLCCESYTKASSSIQFLLFFLFSATGVEALFCNIIGKGKPILLTDRGGPWGCEMSRFPHFLNNRLNVM
jgi:hypothetical protein